MVDLTRKAAGQQFPLRSSDARLCFRQAGIADWLKPLVMAGVREMLQVVTESAAMPRIECAVTALTVYVGRARPRFDRRQRTLGAANAHSGRGHRSGPGLGIELLIRAPRSGSHSSSGTSSEDVGPQPGLSRLHHCLNAGVTARPVV
ncbi:hypothetical protein LAUMK41_03785 [Mycobacterium attenuatum]|nr:hypothetical protein LAUMK41_03785 [Mycobacterium attenuatum]